MLRWLPRLWLGAQNRFRMDLARNCHTSTDTVLLNLQLNMHCGAHTRCFLIVRLKQFLSRGRARRLSGCPVKCKCKEDGEG